MVREENIMKDRWIALYVENQVGVLAKVSGLFREIIQFAESRQLARQRTRRFPRMTICVTSDDITFEQIKSSWNRMVEVIKAIDLTGCTDSYERGFCSQKVLRVNAAEKEEVFQIAQVFNVQVADIGNDSVPLECKLTAHRNNELIALLKIEI